MNRRKGIIATLVGLLPILAKAQLQSFASTKPMNPSVTFMGANGTNTIKIEWDLDNSELVVSGDKREARVSIKEIMDSLYAKNISK